jgi:cellulase
MDIWEANARGQQLAPHVCNKTGLYQCTGPECQFDGVCDKNGCGLNPYRLGNQNFYGQGKIVDTTKPFTVVTQFPADANGKLTEIRRFYIQEGRVINTPLVNIAGPPKIDHLTDPYCAATGAKRYMDLGATETMGGALTRGMVLIFSIWWDEGGFMKWLDSGEAGPCNDTEGDPKNIRTKEKDPMLKYSKIKWGEIGSTYEVPHHDHGGAELES